MKKSKPNMDTLSAEIVRLSDLRRDMERRDWNSRVLPKIEAMIGKAFVYLRNCYSCPQKESDYWSTYRLLQAIVRKDGYAIAIYKECFIDSRGMAMIHTVLDVVQGEAQMPRSGWQRYPTRLFWTNHARAARELNNPKRAIARERAE